MNSRFRTRHQGRKRRGLKELPSFLPQPSNEEVLDTLLSGKEAGTGTAEFIQLFASVILANLLLSLGALLTCLIFETISYSVVLSSFGSVRIAVPSLPVGLVIYLTVVVILSTVLASFFQLDARQKRNG